MRISKECALELIKLLQVGLDDYEGNYHLIPMGYPGAEDYFVQIIQRWSENVLRDATIE